MSILTELKKLTKKKNATVVSQALPDSLDGSGSGGGGDPVIVDITKISSGSGTWSGATWEELVDAYYHGMAFVRFSSAAIAPETTGQMVVELNMYVDVPDSQTDASSALYAMLGGDPMILDNLGGVTGNLP